MEGVRTDAQWIVMMGFLVSIGIFFLALVISQSTLVGQTTAEGVLEFPKNDIQDLRSAILEVEKYERVRKPASKVLENISRDIRTIALFRRNSNVWYEISTLETTCSSCPAAPCDKIRPVNIHFNNGVTAYNETTGVRYVVSC